MEATRHEYWLPTYGLEYPATGGGSKGAVSTQLFRPVEYQSTQKLLSDIRAERSGKGDGRRVLQQHDRMETIEVPLKVLEVRASVQNKTLWKAFMKLGNEMIVTKPGRCLFPTLMASLRGLEPRRMYEVSLRMSSVDNYRYKYSNNVWTKAGESDIIQNRDRQTFLHPCSPTCGNFWMKRPISFKSIKITHYPNSKNGNILLHTMHKYIIEIVVMPTDGSEPLILTLPETTFIAVSAYQNSEVIKMKIDNNPFAKAFKYQDKNAIMEHFNMTENKPQKQVTPPPSISSKPGVVPFLPVLANTSKGDPPISSPLPPPPPLLTTVSIPKPIPFTPVPSLLTGKPMTSSNSPVPVVPLPLVPAPVQANLLPLVSPLVSPYMLLMLCNQLSQNKQQNLVETITPRMAEVGDKMKE